MVRFEDLHFSVLEKHTRHKHCKATTGYGKRYSEFTSLKSFEAYFFTSLKTFRVCLTLCSVYLSGVVTPILIEVGGEISMLLCEQKLFPAEETNKIVLFTTLEYTI